MVRNPGILRSGITYLRIGTPTSNQLIGIEVDPIFTSSPAATITTTEINNWNSNIGTTPDKRAGHEILVAGLNTIYLKINGIPVSYNVGEKYAIPRAYCIDAATGSVVEPILSNFTISSFDCDIGGSGTIDYETTRI